MSKIGKIVFVGLGPGHRAAGAERSSDTGQVQHPGAGQVRREAGGPAEARIDGCPGVDFMDLRFRRNSVRTNYIHTDHLVMAKISFKILGTQHSA
jgi:hypothetical protein